MYHTIRISAGGTKTCDCYEVCSFNPLPFTFACLLNCMTWTVVDWWKMQPSDFNIYFPNMMGLACAVAQLVLKGIYGNSPTKDLPK